MRAGTIESYQERLNRVLTHIAKRLDDPLPLDELAGVAHLSSYHFHRIFRGMVGESVKEHIRRLRLERAAQRLRDGNDSILQIALGAGYETHESFTRAFGAMFGESPSEFRERRKRPTSAKTGQIWGTTPNTNHSTTHGTNPDSGADAGPMDVRVERIEPVRLAFVRHVGPFHQVSIAWQKLCMWAGPKGLFAGNPTLMGIVHDDPEITPPEHLRYDAALVVDGRVQPEGEVGVQETPGGEFAITTHKGPYETLYITYARLCGEWLPASGREVRERPSLEFYRNSPMTVPPPELITDICLPLEEE